MFYVWLCKTIYVYIWMHATFGWTCFELDQIEVYNLKFRGLTRKGQKLLEYIYISTNCFSPLTFKGSARDGLVYFSSSQCDALYVQLFAVQFNFINNSFNNTIMNYDIWLLLRMLKLTCLFVFLTITSVL